MQNGWTKKNLGKVNDSFGEISGCIQYVGMLTCNVRTCSFLKFLLGYTGVFVVLLEVKCVTKYKFFYLVTDHQSTKSTCFTLK